MPKYWKYNSGSIILVIIAYFPTGSIILIIISQLKYNSGNISRLEYNSGKCVFPDWKYNSGNNFPLSNVTNFFKAQEMVVFATYNLN